MILWMALLIPLQKILKMLAYINYTISVTAEPVQLLDFIASLEKVLDISAIKKMLPMQAGDVHQTFADTSRLEHDYNYKPQIAVDKGIKAFVLWYKGFYNK